MEHDKKIKVGITHGDINGIGYEVLLKALGDTRITELCTPVIYGSAKIANYYRKGMELPEFKLFQIDSPDSAATDEINIINVVGEDCKLEPGQPTPNGGKAALAALERAVSDLRDGLIDVLVTAPINKKTIHSDDFNFPGHTEYLQDRLGEGHQAMMIMCAEGLRVALVTIHEPISNVAGSITSKGITDKLVAFNRSLVEDFGIHGPRIAVLSLNPHAGDGGIIGSEETEIIAPAIEEAMKRKVLAFGPYAPDGFFGSGNYTKFDGVLAMYHDQGLTPFKVLAGERGVNFTAGLPYVRTSPDHGTAYDIVGQGKADEQSMREAIYSAIDIYRNRRREAAATANPLRHQSYDKGNDKLPVEKA
ncbi:MAG: 4-hydroxythreonine-4-phosphate dehydrogenase PdxA [Muribaculaceae bacterium]|jgi:4-hydroxythreonine-4-phosphate dehydrogenase|uniref:4-hydroxythreonine-4-phosphate dehydrogenase PdxA n=1 Tax=Duncaniella dubosii TaxID=2518971 RepID=A0A4P7W2S7_9BACT|nr:4-hydroxythreonine-4-phosphate dehydrogenase PdxA [Duncaniella dubosii]MBJ2191121.1 4-hydroxythreonine-4-phosphate dehydrogenase PdxA [Muribaculaceae bacterium]QCD41720.1 4-hydroxythreonine-4-phosphate dehydrogenase PdxA [Duncaniella dubosii]ROS89239.1 4-hydroxythreonine-4-phosphate dehydrogenase PdxA [Muribaculaceae bacterium Isolate-080 (Janvier)]